MNQEKIGKFISKVRKEKKITQKQLAEKLGITDRAISKWENGKSMPDLALLKPLCDILNITINELLSGEYVDKSEKEERLESNIVNAINYSKKKQNIYELIFLLFILLFGTIMIVMSMSIFSTPISFTLWYSIIGTYNLMIIFSYFLKIIVTNNKAKKYIIILIVGFFTLYFGYLGIVDYINVKNNNAYPDIFVISSATAAISNDTTTNSYSYDTFFYDLYICNVNEEDEYRKLVIDLKHKNIFDRTLKHCNK